MQNTVDSHLHILNTSKKNWLTWELTISHDGFTYFSFSCKKFLIGVLVVMYCMLFQHGLVKSLLCFEQNWVFVQFMMLVSQCFYLHNCQERSSGELKTILSNVLGRKYSPPGFAKWTNVCSFSFSLIKLSQ